MAVGRKFKLNLDHTESVEYEIVGLLPYSDNRFIKNQFDLIEGVAGNFMSRYMGLETVVINPQAKVFNEVYQQSKKRALLGYEEGFDFRNSGFRHFDQSILGDYEVVFYINGFRYELDVEKMISDLKKVLQFFTVVSMVVAMVQMMGMMTIVLKDENSQIALYRIMGASNKDIMMIFGGYLLVLAVLIILFATIIGIILFMIMSYLYTGLFGAVIDMLFLDKNWQMLVGVDCAMMGLIYLLIFLSSIGSFLGILGKLRTKKLALELDK